MADLRLDTADRDVLTCTVGVAEDVDEAVNLGRVPGAGPRAMRLDQAHAER